MIRAVNIRWGLGWGLAFAAFYCVIALVLNALSDGEAFPEKRVTLPQVLVLYVTCGVLAGLVVGALRPLTKTKMGATVVGTIVAFPVSMGFGLLHSGAPWLWPEETWIATLVFALVFGVMGTEVLWDKPSA